MIYTTDWQPPTLAAAATTAAAVAAAAATSKPVSGLHVGRLMRPSANHTSVCLSARLTDWHRVRTGDVALKPSVERPVDVTELRSARVNVSVGADTSEYRCMCVCACACFDQKRRCAMSAFSRIWPHVTLSAMRTFVHLGNVDCVMNRDQYIRFSGHLFCGPF